MSSAVLSSAHALLSASGTHRWWSCPGSIRLSEGIEQKSSSWAEEGTRAHEIAANWLLGTEPGPEVEPEMRAGVELYVETVRGEIAPGDQLLIEQRVSLDPLDPPVPMFGTCDALIIQERRRALSVIDLKYGAGVPVEAEGNLQLHYYGLAALLAVPAGTIDTIKMTIVQPRAPHPEGPIRSEILTAQELELWGNELLAAAHRALAPEAPLAPGSWCRFCAAQSRCPALKAQALSDAADEFGAFPLQ